MAIHLRRDLESLQRRSLRLGGSSNRRFKRRSPVAHRTRFWAQEVIAGDAHIDHTENGSRRSASGSRAASAGGDRPPPHRRRRSRSTTTSSAWGTSRRTSPSARSIWRGAPSLPVPANCSDGRPHERHGPQEPDSFINLDASSPARLPMDDEVDRYNAEIIAELLAHEGSTTSWIRRLAVSATRISSASPTTPPTSPRTSSISSKAKSSATARSVRRNPPPIHRFAGLLNCPHSTGANHADGISHNHFAYIDLDCRDFASSKRSRIHCANPRVCPGRRLA